MQMVKLEYKSWGTKAWVYKLQGLASHKTKLNIDGSYKVYKTMFCPFHVP